MRFAVLPLLLPGILSAQELQTRTRATTSVVLPTGTAELGGVSLDPNAPVVADMPAPRVELIESGPTFVRLSWNAVVGASGYVVYRNDLGPLNSPPLPLTTTSFTHRANNDYRLTYTYTVVAQYPNGHTGPSNSISYTPPKPPAPTEFDSKEQGNDIVVTWSMPAGVYAPDRFMLFGPGLGDGVVIPGDKYTYVLEGPDLAEQQLRGELRFTMSAVYEPGGVTAPAAEWPRTTFPYWTGRYRFTILGVTAQQTTNDDSPWHRDGKGDEIFLAASVHRYAQSTGTLLETTAMRTRVYGESARFPGRLTAGTIPGGGIRQGDLVYPATTPAGVPADSSLPLIIWEGQLFPDDVLVIRPMVFEFDHVDDAASCYARWRRAVMTRIDRDPKSYTWPLTHELSVPVIRTDLRQLESGGVNTGIQITPQCAADQHLDDDRVITFSLGKIDRFRNLGLMPDLTFVGVVNGPYSSGGRYRVPIRIERLPDPPVQAIRR
jgi:hypothetical protein